MNKEILKFLLVYVAKHGDSVDNSTASRYISELNYADVLAANSIDLSSVGAHDAGIAKVSAKPTTGAAAK